MRIVWNSFHGRFSDNPRALWERLADRTDLEHVWLADGEHLAAFPEGVTTVDIDSPAATEALESADLLIANTHTEVKWAKTDRTTYVQTWHGTPLKRIHRDVLWAPEGRLDRLDHDVAKWDLLLSPNAVSTPRLRGAFGYDGEVLESGYPRNDLLSLPEAREVGAAVRARLGVPEDTRVVLYTPTWRDDEAFAEGRPEVRLQLDVERFAATLGPDHVLLVRAHNMVTGRSRIADTPGVHDVSYLPDVRDLYCAADAMVTDYSSTMFDFAITGRPIVHYAYDLERFQDAVRGFYFDLLPEAPGPVVRTEDELLDVLGDLDRVEKEHAERYAAFRERYTSLEDGRATDRVLARLGL
ncbi:CDP-glycerol glycerophosphotransferase family protein [Nocardioides sp. SOB77]|uniref:CDP-glycerol glycerophosphotransferase family protein n=1 Tax=Nocardioides oceani TaxID=3058369 RepID=A0ABT8FD28_9ACTN|nr:CDP-glycerol glycerophosphotransferase family protein [Nocardioides oceani]MDN4172593.1 CDP-glycerol glycerophosphotransferase family protein [Nocardioides oceani]